MNRSLTATTAVVILLATVVMSTRAQAQEAPAPHRMPRAPVNQQALYSHHDSLMQSREIQGQPMIIDGEKLKIGDVELRLFGIVPPQLSANFGPQARATLDSLASGQNIDCAIRDRDHDGRFLATCRTASNADLALELLKRGLAVTARGSLSGTDLATPYLAAEQAAQTQRLGLWSTSVPAAAQPATAPVEAPKPELQKLENIASALVAEVKKDKADKPADKPVIDNTAAAALATAPMIKNAIVTASVAAPPVILPEDPVVVSAAPGFIERYQLLMTGLVMLATALTLFAVMATRQRSERRTELRAIAAALRGELMAARSICQSRVKAIVTEADDKAFAWPRLRSTLYQAYVGRLGFLGADLARQIASIYGQASDYALYYNSDAGRADPMPKRQNLQNLVNYIDEVTPKLAIIEQSGEVPFSFRQARAPALPASAGTMILSATSNRIAPPARPLPVPPESITSSRSVSRANAARETVTREVSAPPVETVENAVSLATSSGPVTPLPPPAASGPAVSISSVNAVKPPAPPTMSPATNATAKPAAARATAPTDEKTSGEKSAAARPGAGASFADYTQAPLHLWEAVRNFARDHLPERQPAPTDDHGSDYTRMIEEEMSNYAFDDHDADLHDQTIASYTSKLRDTGS